MTASVQIETESLSLRELTSGDLDLIVDLYGDPETMDSYRGVLSSQDSQVWLEGVITSWKKKGYGYWALFLKDTGTFIGSAGLFDQEIEGVWETEVGYVIQRQHWGQGFASEVAAACYDFALNRTDLERVVTIIDPRNSAAVHLAEKYGLSFLRQSAKWGRVVHIYAKTRAAAPG